MRQQRQPDVARPRAFDARTEKRRRPAARRGRPPTSTSAAPYSWPVSWPSSGSAPSSRSAACATPYSLGAAVRVASRFELGSIDPTVSLPRHRAAPPPRPARPLNRAVRTPRPEQPSRHYAHISSQPEHWRKRRAGVPALGSSALHGRVRSDAHGRRERVRSTAMRTRRSSRVDRRTGGVGG
jgi:hypothetical protein